MKNVIKKISAIAMAFTLLGAGTTFTKSSSKSDNILVAAAATCQYHHGTVVQGHYINNARWETQTVTSKKTIRHYDRWSGTTHKDTVTTTYEYKVCICRACGREVSRGLVSKSINVDCPF